MKVSNYAFLFCFTSFIICVFLFHVFVMWMSFIEGQKSCSFCENLMPLSILLNAISLQDLAGLKKSSLADNLGCLRKTWVSVLHSPTQHGSRARQVESSAERYELRGELTERRNRAK